MPWDIIGVVGIITVLWGFAKGLKTKNKRYVRKN